MTDHPITPPPELVQQWAKQMLSLDGQGGELAVDLDWFATQAARWGADQELEACCEWLDKEIGAIDLVDLRAARRPKLPSLQIQALNDLEEIAATLIKNNLPCNTGFIRRALEQFDD